MGCVQCLGFVMKRAFTLIELLVVIAIIAILAAILFPVFAQAKEAAKKTQGIAQIKQVGTGIILYTGDNEDTFPLTVVPSAGGTWQYNLVGEVPVNWRINNAATNERHSVYYANSISSYLKNMQLQAHPQGTDQSAPATTALVGFPAAARVGTTANGLLNSYSMTAVAAPSLLTMLWFGYGRTNRVGQHLPNPQIRCGASVSEACRFNSTGYPDSSNGGGSSFGSAFFTVSGQTTHWAYGQGNVFVRTDTSAKYLRIGRPGGGSTGFDMLQDPFSVYDANGLASSYTGCRPTGSTGPYYWCMFRPDREQ